MKCIFSEPWSILYIGIYKKKEKGAVGQNKHARALNYTVVKRPDGVHLRLLLHFRVDIWSASKERGVFYKAADNF